MKPMDILKNMNDLDEKYLAEGERFPENPLKLLTLRRVGAIAAAVALLTVTAFAAVIGINYWLGMDEYGYYTIDFEFPLEPVAIEQEALDDMTRQLVWALNDYNEQVAAGYNNPHFSTVGRPYYDRLWSAFLPEPEEIMSMEDLEAYLGVTLTTSPEIRAAFNANCATMDPEFSPFSVRIFARPYEEMMAEYEATGTVVPQGLDIALGLLDEGENNWSVGYHVHIALTEEFAENYRPLSWDSFEDRGQYYTEEYNNGSRDFLVAKLDHTKEYGGVCLMLYEDGGIGYFLSCQTWPTDLSESEMDEDHLLTVLGRDFDGEVSTDPQEILLPLIENVE